MVGGRAGPEEAPLGGGDGDVVDAGLAAIHVAVGVEFPVLVAIAAPPATGLVVPFVLESHGDAVGAERPQALAQGVVLLVLPLAGEEGDDLIVAVEELGAVAPDRVRGVGADDPRRVPCVPGVFGGLHLVAGTGFVERWHGRSVRCGVVGHGGQTVTTGKSTSTPAALLK